MVKRKYSIEVMKYMTLFESLTGAKLKDCLINGSLIFIVQENEMGKAIGKNGSNLKRIEKAFNKKIKLVEFSNNACKFISNLIYPSKADDIKEEEGVINIHIKDTKTKGIVIGRDRKNIYSINEIVKRYFNAEVEVV